MTKRVDMLQMRTVLSCIVIAFSLVQLFVSTIAIQIIQIPARSGNTICGYTRLPSALWSTSETSMDGKDPTRNSDIANNRISFSIVPASTNRSNKFTTQLLEDVLPFQLHATDAKLLDESNGGRLTFTVPAPFQHSNSPTGAQWGQYLSPYGVKSLRLVVCECEIPVAPEDNKKYNGDAAPLQPDRQGFILQTLEENLPQQGLPWKIYHEIFGNTPPSTLSGSTENQPNNLEISCRRWASSRAISKNEFSSTSMKHALRRMILRKYHRDEFAQWLDDCEFTLLLYKTKLRLEWTVLVPPKSKRFSEADYLPKPGCKRVEAWMLMKNLEQVVLQEIVDRKRRNKTIAKKEEVIVLDPLCGKGTFLVEAATTWKMMPSDRVSVSFVGVDASDDQLLDAKMNVNAVADGDENKHGSCGEHDRSKSSKNDCVLITKRQSHDQTSTISLYKGDSRDLSLFADGSVAAIATCPPFGRQFFALEKESGIPNNSEDLLAASYRDWLREWNRTLDPLNGRIALLVDVDHQKEALDAIALTGTLQVTVLREPFRLGRVRATVIVADAMPTHSRKDNVQNDSPKTELSEPLSRFPWEGTAKEARAEWARLRAASLQGLEPYTKVQR